MTEGLRRKAGPPPPIFDEIPPERQPEVEFYARYLFDHVGGYRGTERDAMTDACWMVHSLLQTTQ